MRTQWRQGDVLFERVNDIPREATPRAGGVLFVGERSGHAHRIEEGATADVYELGRSLFLKVALTTSIVHDEHRPIVLEPGSYRVWRQQEFRDGRGQDVQD
jgi:hypothetical protein